MPTPILGLSAARDAVAGSSSTGTTFRWWGEGIGSNVRCAAVTRAGERCKAEATHGSYCWNHAPEFASERKQRASRAGRTGGNGRPGSPAGEITDLKRRLLEVTDAVLEGRVDRGRAAVAIQGYNALRSVLEQERKLKETEELEARLEALEHLQPTAGARGVWYR